MKILSNFDTDMANTLYCEYVQLFGAEYVALVKKSKLIWYATVRIPIISYLLVLLIGIYFVYSYDMPHQAVYRIFRAIMLLRAFWLFITLSWRYVDLKMDFLIVTPKEVIKYDQRGMFSRVSEKIAADKIKTMTIQKHGFLASFFDIGSIVFLAEWDSEEGDIVMDQIDAVEATEKKLRHILGQDRM